jgi:hypothetical protein
MNIQLMVLSCEIKQGGIINEVDTGYSYRTTDS